MNDYYQELEAEKGYIEKYHTTNRLARQRAQSWSRAKLLFIAPDIPTSVFRATQKAAR